MLQAAQQDAPQLPNLTASSKYFEQRPNGSGLCTGTACGAAPPSCTGGRVLIFVQVNTTASYTPMVSFPGQGHSILARVEARDAICIIIETRPCSSSTEIYHIPPPSQTHVILLANCFS